MYEGLSASSEETLRSGPQRQNINSPRPAQTGAPVITAHAGKVSPAACPSNSPELQTASRLPQRQPDGPQDKAACSPEAGRASITWAPKAIFPGAYFNPWILISVLVRTHSVFPHEPGLPRGAAAPGLQNQLPCCPSTARLQAARGGPAPLNCSAPWHLTSSGSWLARSTAQGHTWEFLLHTELREEKTHLSTF